MCVSRMTEKNRMTSLMIVLLLLAIPLTVYAEDAGEGVWQQIANVDFTTINDEQSRELAQTLAGLTAAQFNAWMTDVMAEEDSLKRQAALEWLEKYQFIGTPCSDPDTLARRTFSPSTSASWSWPPYIPMPVYGSISSVSVGVDILQITLYMTGEAFAQWADKIGENGVYQIFDTHEAKAKISEAVAKLLGPKAKSNSDILEDTGETITSEIGCKRMDGEGWALFSFGGGNTAVITVSQAGTTPQLDALAAQSDSVSGDSKQTSTGNKMITEVIVKENEIGIYSTSATGETGSVTLNKSQAGAATLAVLGAYYDAEISGAAKYRVLDYLEGLNEDNFVKALALYESYMTADEYNAFLQFLCTSEKLEARMFTDDPGAYDNAGNISDGTKITAEVILPDDYTGLFANGSTTETKNYTENKSQAAAATLAVLGVYYDAEISGAAKYRVLDYLEGLSETDFRKALARYESYMTGDEYNAFIQFLCTSEKLETRMFSDDPGAYGDSGDHGDEENSTAETILNDYNIGLCMTSVSGEITSILLTKAQAGVAAVAALGIYYDVTLSDAQKQKVLDYIEHLNEDHLTKTLALYESYMTPDAFSEFVQFLRRSTESTVDTKGTADAAGEANGIASDDASGTQALVQDFEQYATMSADELQAYIDRFSGMWIGDVKIFFQSLTDRQYPRETITQFAALLMNNGVPVPAEYFKPSGSQEN